METNLYYNTYKYDRWDGKEESFKNTKEMILLILKEQKVSLSQIRYLFNNILDDIERENPIN